MVSFFYHERLMDSCAFDANEAKVIINIKKIRKENQIYEVEQVEYNLDSKIIEIHLTDFVKNK